MSKPERFEDFAARLREFQVERFATALQPIEQAAAVETARIIAAGQLESWWELS